MFSARQIALMQESLTRLWHEVVPGSGAASATIDSVGEPSPAVVFLQTVAAQHKANFELWHEEDKARAPGASDADIAEVKHAIDRINQRRNDLAEECDLMLMQFLEGRGLPAAGAELHSETPGLIIDRLSILALKLFHTQEEIDRRDAPPGHAERNRQRYVILINQRDDLVGCLDRLWQQVLAGERRVKIYRQMKMYNDPTLNPALYSKG